MTKIKLQKYTDTSIVYSVLEMDESIRGKGEIFKYTRDNESNFYISSLDNPQLNPCDIYLCGSDKARDKHIDILNFNTAEECDKWLENAVTVINAYNAFKHIDCDLELTPGDQIVCRNGENDRKHGTFITIFNGEYYCILKGSFAAYPFNYAEKKQSEFEQGKDGVYYLL